ncbi:MAG: Rieske (2Fe-2S) protein [Gemmatimonadaceae bacterium]|nr:Rieske (2Fe-2S) protein [Gemmatimonadaceae bacterium]
MARPEVELPLSSLPNPGLLPVRLPNGDRIVLIRRGNMVTALEDECSHQAMPLSAGELLTDGTVQCPWHGARFDASSGACRQGPATDPVATWVVTVTGDRVVIGARQSTP